MQQLRLAHCKQCRKIDRPRLRCGFPRAAESMNLKEGDSAYGIIKASSVMIGQD